ncbi:MAG: hypothetical protein JRJ80_18920 [Deltaproteobacteria bacterium]|nr:hypothetical protein [Deltaproteobacteria bacterium]MBW2159085.1 hypothetical protein [Deltaproteobacteria bacterium]
MFFGIIVATITGYFMRPLRRPVNQIVETIEHNLENLQDLSVEELDLLKETTDSLILYMEEIKEKRPD